MKKIINKLIIIIIILLSIRYPIYADQADFEMYIVGYTDAGVSFNKGGKGISYKSSYIDLKYNSFYYKKSQSFGVSNIKVYANGKDVDTNKFDISFAEGSIRLKLKDGPAANDYKHPLQLRKHCLYNVYIDSGMFVTADGKSKTINYTFVTDTDEDYYQRDILKSTYPKDGDHDISPINQKIYFEFADYIALTQAATSNIKDYITISNTPIGINIPAYAYESIDNYKVYADGNRLILEPKIQSLKNFSKYTVKLKDNAVYLKSSIDTDGKILNRDEQNRGYTEISFYTDQFISRIEPSKDQENVEIEPTIKINFLYPVEILNTASIKLIENDADEYSYDVSNDIKLSDDKMTLMINIDDLEDRKIYPLRRQTLYKVSIGKDSVKLRDYKSYSTGGDLTNNSYEFCFITRGDGDDPVPIAYLSEINSTKDIRDIKSTDLYYYGSFYIKFDRDIKWDKQYDTQEKILNAMKLYKIPKAYSTKYNTEGKIFDDIWAFDTQNANALPILKPDDKIVPKDEVEDELHTPIPIDELLISGAEIVNGNYLKITPKYPLQSLNKYKFHMKKNILEDTNTINLAKDLEFTFWTKAYPIPESTDWKGIANITAQNIYETKDAPIRYYKLYGVPAYSDQSPITINITGEVIPKAQDIGGLISYDALKNITLQDYYDEAASNITIKKIELHYSYENGKKVTALHIYPSSQLEYGKTYELDIPADTLETRSGDMLKALNIIFAVQGNNSYGKAITSIENGIININDLYKNGWTLKVFGYNFNEDIKSVKLIGTNNTNRIPLQTQSIKFINVNQIQLKVTEEILKVITNEDHIGTYRLDIEYGDETISKEGIEIKSKGKPEPIWSESYPYGSVRIDPNAFHSKTIDGKKIYFMVLKFDDPCDKLIFDYANGLSKLVDDTKTIVCADKTATSMIDKTFIAGIQKLSSKEQGQKIESYIFIADRSKGVKYLTIPVKLLTDNINYKVKLAEGIVKYSDISSTSGENNILEWGFSTMYKPIAGELMTGSVPEDYNEDEPIIVYGEKLYKTKMKVYFNETPAASFTWKTDSSGKEYMEIYLPKDSNKLAPGIYDIIVKNDDNHTDKFGTISVVASSSWLPNDEYTLKSSKYGSIKEFVLKSEDTLVLRDKYSDMSKVTIDLDKIMGTDVWIRNIEYQGDGRDIINLLETKSKWVDINIKNLYIDTNVYKYEDDDEDEDDKKKDKDEDDKDDEDSDEYDHILSIGRLQPSKIEYMTDRLYGQEIRSDFIQVNLQYMVLDEVEIKLPYKGSNDKNLKVVCYNEDERSLTTVKNIKIDALNKKVIFTNYTPGIYVIVENAE